MRRITAAGLVLAMHVAALGAPLVHAHPDDHATAHHHGRAVHSHWSAHGDPHHAARHHDSQLPAFDDDDDHDRAVSFGAFVAVAAAQLFGPVVVVEAWDVPVPEERAAHPAVAVSHGHDPPAIPPGPSRAPPALPVLI